jgi:hypothetical protein
MHTSDLRRAAAALAAALLAAATPAAAQTVHGTLVDPAGAPVAQVLVALVDSAGKQRAAALTTSTGEFTIRAPAGGRYSLRAERVGYATVTSPAFDLAEGDVREQRMVASSRPVTLQALVITPRARRCAVRPGAGVATATLWEEARKALAAAEYASRAGLFWYDVVRWERDVSAGSGAVTRDLRRTRGGVAELPFVSVPPEELSRFGFIRRFPGDSLVYAAPDAAVLLSDQFLDDHCFRTTTGDDPRLVGLEFEPVRGRIVPDVTGVLWLDRATAELRKVEYRYVNGPAESRERGVGGTVEFERLHDGPWIVRRWAIRMPIAEILSKRRVGIDSRSPVRRDELRLLALREAGGEVTSARSLVNGVPGRPLGSVAGAAPAVVEGMVWDSIARAPLAGARVFLSGTAAEAITGRDGRYRLEAPAAGSYTLAFSAPELGPVSAAVQPRLVSAEAGMTVRADLAVPAAPRVTAALCPATALRIHRGLVTGRLMGMPVDSVTVRASWQQVAVTANAIQGRADFVEDRPDASGFVLCGVPEGSTVEVAIRSLRNVRERANAALSRETLRAAGRELERVEVNLAPGVPLRVDVGPGARARENTAPRPE